MIVFLPCSWIDIQRFILYIGVLTLKLSDTQYNPVNNVKSIYIRDNLVLFDISMLSRDIFVTVDIKYKHRVIASYHSYT